jgi:hypothetical protein
MNKKWSAWRIVAVTLIGLLLGAGVYLYVNFNRLASEAVMTSFNSSIISDVYELKFERLRVNILKGDVRVVNVVVQPRETPLGDYPYINSSLSLQAERITLSDVQLWPLFTSGVLTLKEISILKPEIRLDMFEARPNLVPFRDSVTTDTGQGKKKALSIALTHFRLEDAAIHVTNAYRSSDTDVAKFNMTLDDLVIDQKPDTNFISLGRIDLLISDFKRSNKVGPFSNSSFGKFQVGGDSLRVQLTRDTLTFGMREFTTGINDLDLHTADSLIHVTLGTFSSSYRNGRVSMTGLSFTPNISKEAMQARYKFQNVQVSGKVESVDIRNINFDSLIYYKRLLIDTIAIGKPELSVFKDKTKPIDSTRNPPYLGQVIAAIKLPLRIRHVQVEDIHLVNEEKKPDSTYAKVTIERGTARVSNITNLSKSAPLVLSAAADLSGKVHFDMRLAFSYKKPQFELAGSIGKFQLPDLNALLRAYTPATITKGVADQMKFSATANWTSASGMMTFLYHDLEVDLALKDQQKWKSSVLTFAANTIVDSSNPASTDVPARVVRLHADRDMNKGFVNIILKCVLNGVKETLLMSKENRAAYQAKKKRMRK